MLNKVIIMGRLTKDPELRTTTSGVSVTSFTVAVDRGYVKAGEERQTDFLTVVAWRQTAEFVTRYFHKGSMIAVEGSIQNVRDTGPAIRMVLYEGRNRQIRKMCEKVGLTVKKLRRDAYGDLELDIKKGTWRYLRREEVDYLKNNAGTKR